ncbi:MAG TPA: hypothetical protein VH165_02100, partial [Kofleriaceae bacterium]|nr:hypothetical protein [Kofleriaceae bacterium]
MSAAATRAGGHGLGRGARAGLEALVLVMRYILLVNDHVEPATLQAFLERVAGPDTKETIVTAGEQLIQKGVELG